jgi:hypothetical protein
MQSLILIVLESYEAAYQRLGNNLGQTIYLLSKVVHIVFVWSLILIDKL